MNTDHTLGDGDETQRRRRGHDFYPPAELAATIPALYGADAVALPEQTIHLHYFAGACDWWVTEYDPSDRLGFGYACLGDPQSAEWGYVSLAELETLAITHMPLFIVERDLHWTAKQAKDADLPGCPW